MVHEDDCSIHVAPVTDGHCGKCHCSCGTVSHVGEVGHPDGCPGGGH